MQIKKRLNAVAKRLTPEIEAMNVAQEMTRITTRLEELATYGEAKAARAKRSREGKESMGVRQDREAKAERKRIADIHNAEAEETAKDRQQAAAQPDAEVADAGGESTEAE